MLPLLEIHKGSTVIDLLTIEKVGKCDRSLLGLLGNEGYCKGMLNMPSQPTGNNYSITLILQDKHEYFLYLTTSQLNMKPALEFCVSACASEMTGTTIMKSAVRESQAKRA